MPGFDNLGSNGTGMDVAVPGGTPAGDTPNHPSTSMESGKPPTVTGPNDQGK